MIVAEARTSMTVGGSDSHADRNDRRQEVNLTTGRFDNGGECPYTCKGQTEWVKK